MSTAEAIPNAKCTDEIQTKDGVQSTDTAPVPDIKQEDATDKPDQIQTKDGAQYTASPETGFKPEDATFKPVDSKTELPPLKRDFSVPTLTVEEKRKFYKSIFSPCGKLSQELTAKAKDELNETEETRQEKLTELRNMLQNEGGTGKGEAVFEYFQEKDDRYLVRFLRTKKFDVKKTYEMMTAYVNFRMKYKNITEQLNYDGVSPALKMSLPGVLPHKDKQGRVVLIYDTGSWDPQQVSFDEMLASFLFLLENLVENEENQIRGFVFIETYEKYHITQALQMKASDIKKLADMLQGAFPGRFKGFHVIRQPWYFSLLMTLAKPFMGNKMASRIFVHGFNLKGLYEWIGPEYLPENFGGIGEDYDPQPLLDELKDCLLQRGEMRF